MRFYKKRNEGVVMLKKIGLILLICSSIICLKTALVQASTVGEKSNKTPTLFFHGYSSGVHAEEYMAEGAFKAGKTNTAIIANVSRTGKVKLYDKIKANSKNPLVLVNFEANRVKNYNTLGKWVRNVLVKLKSKYKITKFNAVGHSMGNMAIMYYLLKYGNKSNLPKLQRQVALAGHFNGLPRKVDKPDETIIARNGRPDLMSSAYKKLLRLRGYYEKNRIKVLNIYGTLPHEDSDGRVNNNTSRSLRYIVDDNHNYQQKQLRGANVSHSRLRHNKRVNKMINKFLWSSNKKTKATINQG